MLVIDLEHQFKWAIACLTFTLSVNRVICYESTRKRVIRLIYSTYFDCYASSLTPNFSYFGICCVLSYVVCCLTDIRSSCIAFCHTSDRQMSIRDGKTIIHQLVDNSAILINPFDCGLWSPYGPALERCVVAFSEVSCSLWTDNKLGLF